MLAADGCAGIDEGDGFDCYGVPVADGDPRTRRLTGVEQAEVWRKLRAAAPQWYALEEQAHIKAGTFGVEGLTLYRQQTGDVQGLPTVNVVGRNFGFLVLVGLVTLAVAMSDKRRA